MKISRSRLLVLLVTTIVTWPMAAVGCEVRTGEHSAQITIKGVRGAEDISASFATIGDVPHHQLSQRVYRFALSSPDAPDFDGATTLNFVHADSTSGGGKHEGYATWTLKSGDTVQVRFVGAHSTPKAGVEQTPNHGTLSLCGGTGKYRDIKGEGEYRGSTSASGGTFETTLPITY